MLTTIFYIEDQNEDRRWEVTLEESRWSDAEDFDSDQVIEILESYGDFEYHGHGMEIGFITEDEISSKNWDSLISDCKDFLETES